MNTTEHHEHPNPDFEDDREARQLRDEHHDPDQDPERERDPTEIPEGVHVPDPASYFRVWHLWLLYTMTILTIVTTGVASFSYTEQKATSNRITEDVTKNTNLICDSARIRQIIPSETKQEAALARLTANTSASCVNTRHDS